ncbi:persephin-like [Ochotona princeps]|uniref:persephin n=1 Tax=Ochotona princeps TaxID=9978 RepID=UPI002714EDDE|nr:persephin [Ochotona princeps]XP_058515859.1 persephin-like [Ochotona princeps]
MEATRVCSPCRLSRWLFQKLPSGSQEGAAVTGLYLALRTGVRAPTVAMGTAMLGAVLLLPLSLQLARASQPWDAPAMVVAATEGEFLSQQVAEAGGTPRRPLGTRLRRAPADPCQLWSLTLPVAELGLGYASEEKVIFRYCAGSCPRGARTQHGLTLAWLQGQGRAHGAPCCRPTRYADVAFLDDRLRWQRLPQLSAAACGCG